MLQIPAIMQFKQGARKLMRGPPTVDPGAAMAWRSACNKCEKRDLAKAEALMDKTRLAKALRSRRNFVVLRSLPSHTPRRAACHVGPAR